MNKMYGIDNIYIYMRIYILVGGLEHVFELFFSIYWEVHHPN